MKGLDLRKFVKVSSDGKKTVLRSKEGHEITIAHSGVSASMRKELDALPLHRAAGGDMIAEASPVQTPKQEQSQAVIEAPAQQTPTEVAPMVDNTQQVQPQAPSPQQLTPEQMSSLRKDQTAQYLKKQDQDWQQDISNGHITPETYSSLFAKKSTLGKIGTIFGLMIGGAGAGLAHQDNALLKQMNNEIQNDLEAQKQSKTNAYNFNKLNYDHQVQEAQIAQMGVQNKLTEAQVGAMPSEIALRQAQAGLSTAQAGAIPSQIEQTKAQTGLIGAQAGAIPSEIALRGAQAGSLNAESRIKADALSHMQANRAAMHFLADKVNNMSLSPEERAKAQQQLGLLSTMIDAQNSDLADKAAGLSALSESLTPGGTSGQDSEAKYRSNQQLLRVGGHKDLADANDLRHVPGIPGQASVPLTEGDREAITAALSFNQQLQKFKQFAKDHPGEIGPKWTNADIAEGRALAAGLQGAYRQATKGGVYKEGEQNFISGIINEDPTVFFNKARVLAPLKAVESDNEIRLNALLKSKGLPLHKASGSSPSPESSKATPAKSTSEGSKPAASSGPKEGATGKDKSGNPVVFSNGAWRRK